MLCWFSSLLWPYDWNWSYVGFLDIIWGMCGSKCRGGSGGIFTKLCVKFCLVSSCFEILIWNLVYTSSRCHTSSSSFIPIGTLWPTLQPKIGQSFFCIHGLKNYIEASDLVHTHLYGECLHPYWFSSWLGNFWPSGTKNPNRELVELPASEKFSRLFLYIHLVGSTTHRVRVSSQSGHSEPFGLKIGQSNFSSFMASTITVSSNINAPNFWEFSAQIFSNH